MQNTHEKKTVRIESYHITNTTRMEPSGYLIHCSPVVCDLVTSRSDYKDWVFAVWLSHRYGLVEKVFPKGEIEDGVELEKWDPGAELKFVRHVDECRFGLPTETRVIDG